jgi:hypothetical protein
MRELAIGPGVAAGPVGPVGPTPLDPVEAVQFVILGVNGNIILL